MIKPKVLHVIDHTDAGGAQVVVRQLIEALNQEFTFGVAVLGRSGVFSEIYQKLGAQVVMIGDRNRWSPLPFISLSRVIRRQGYNLVHTHLLKSNVLGTLAARVTHRKSILHDHSSVSPYFIAFYFNRSFVRRLYSLLHQWSLRLCHHVIVLTPAARAICEESYATGPEKISIVPNGIEPPNSHAMENQSARSIRDELELPSDTRVVIMVGRLEPEKDWMTFLKVAKRVPQLTAVKFAFLAVGSGYQERELRDYASAERLNHVFFLGYRNDVCRLIHASDVFLLTSAFEPFGIVLLEAMSVGCPVIAARTIGPESLVRPGFNGLLAEVGREDDFARNVVRLTEDNVLRCDLIRNAHHTVDIYSIQRTASRVADIYKQSLGRSGS